MLDTEDNTGDDEKRETFPGPAESKNLGMCGKLHDGRPGGLLVALE